MRSNALLLFLGFMPSLSFCAPPPRHRELASLVPIVVKNSPEGNFFDVDVALGDSIFKLEVDTGSSDLWVARPGFQCFDRLNNSQLAPPEVCMYETVPKYDPTMSSTFTKLKNETFGVHYGAGIALGIVGTEEVKLGDFIVHHQPIGVADRITVPGDGISSGILGLGYPLLTSAHPGNSVPNDTISLLTNKVLYEPLLFRMHRQGLIPGWFSLALERLPKGQSAGSGGMMGLGVLPDVKTSGPFVTAPVEITEALPVELTGGKISEWTLTVQSVVWSAGTILRAIKTDTKRFQAVVDSGNFFNQLPQKIADEINAEFIPPATYEAATDSYIVSCDAVPPSFGVTIAGRTLSQSPDDMIFQLPNGTCVSAIKRGSTAEGITLNFLGGGWLQNVVAVFDFGKDEMRFAQRADRGAVFNGTTNSTTNVTPMISLAGQRESPRVGATIALALLTCCISSLILL
ncbi:acid protease [Xylaria sp. FL1042]|nr:acid protease [Xylaria sp. FL1042]